MHLRDLPAGFDLYPLDGVFVNGIGSSPSEKLSVVVGAVEAVGRCEAAFHKSAAGVVGAASLNGPGAEESQGWRWYLFVLRPAI